MIASLRPGQAITLWKWLEDSGLATPLNNVESLMFVDEPTCNRVEWNALKGSWNLALQTLGWGRLLAGDHYPLYDAVQNNGVLSRGYTTLTTSPVVDLNIDGPITGAVNTLYFFTATANLTASTPVTYLWQSAGQPAVLHANQSLTDTAVLSWTMEGTQIITVTATNATGTVSHTHLISITRLPVDRLQIEGPTGGAVRHDYVFTATVNPTATTPITYAWQPVGQPVVLHTNAGLTDMATFSWMNPGSQTILVTATNGLRIASATHTITISVPMERVEIIGPISGTVGVSYAITATTDLTATKPITYLWQITGWPDTVHTNGDLTDTISVSWTVSAHRRSRSLPQMCWQP